MEDWLPPLDLANLEGESRDSFFEHFATTIWGLPRSEAVARVNALIRVSKAGDVIRGTDGEPRVVTPSLAPPVRAPCICTDGLAGIDYTAGIPSEYLHRAASNASARVQRRYKLPSGLVCEYRGLWDGQTLVRAVEPIDGHDMCVFAWEAAWRRPRETDHVHVLYSQVRCVSADDARLGACLGVSRDLQSDLDRFMRMRHKAIGAAASAVTKLRTEYNLFATCLYLGQPTGSNGGHTTAPALWTPPLEKGMPTDATYTQIEFRYSTQISGETVSEIVCVRYGNAVRQGVPLPRWLVMALQLSSVYPDIIAKSIEDASAYFNRGAAITCEIIGVAKLEPAMVDARGQYPGQVVQCADEAGHVAECMLAAQLQHTTWLCVTDVRAWESVRRNADCKEFLVERTLSAQCSDRGTMQRVRRRVRSSPMLRGLAATFPRDTATILALAAWHAEALRASRASLPNNSGFLFPVVPVGTARFERCAWKWAEDMRHSRAPVWSLWSVRASTETPMWGACYFIRCSQWRNLLKRRCIAVPPKMREHVPTRFGVWRPAPAFEEAVRRNMHTEETDKEQQSPASSTDESGGGAEFPHNLPSRNLARASLRENAPNHASTHGIETDDENEVGPSRDIESDDQPDSLSCAECATESTEECLDGDV